MHIDASQLASIAKYGETLAAYADRFAQEFYEILEKTPKISAFLRGLSAPMRQRLIQGQAVHFRRLVLQEGPASQDDVTWNEHIGRIHHEAHVDPIWVLSGYAIYADAFDRYIDALGIDSLTAQQLRTALRKRLQADEYMQMRGYRKAVTEQLHKTREASAIDPLTGLPNRSRIEEEVTRRMAHAQDTGTHLAVVMADLDDFKLVNDQYGRAAGDAVLSQLASRLRVSLRQTEDFSARYAGDEFFVLLGELSAAEDARAILDRLDADLSRPYRFDGQQISCPASLGAAIFPQDGSSVDDLLRHADRALYLAKSRKARRGRRWAFYSELPEPTRRRSDILRDLSDKLLIHYQPVFDIESARCVRVEALARLSTPDGMLYPADFLPRLSAPTDRRALFQAVLDTALRQCAAWSQDGKDWGVSINVDPFLPLGRGFCDLIVAALIRYQVPAQRLTLEILEGGMDVDFSQDEVIGMYRKLADLGVRIALDDLGVEASNLQRLQMLSIQEIKLDRSFVKHIAAIPQKLPFILNLANLAAALGMEFVAEGCESDQDLDVLRHLGVQFMQGYGLQRPVAAGELPLAVMRAELRLRNRHTSPGLVAAYARHLAIEAHLLGLFRQAPHYLDGAVIRNAASCPLLPLMSGHADMQKIHIRQHEIMALLSERSRQDNQTLIAEYILLGKQLRALIAERLGARAMAA
jgi:diguanylate cyclase (GGDEF)-like protein